MSQNIWGTPPFSRYYAAIGPVTPLTEYPIRSWNVSGTPHLVHIMEQLAQPPPSPSTRKRRETYGVHPILSILCSDWPSRHPSPVPDNVAKHMVYTPFCRYYALIDPAATPPRVPDNVAKRLEVHPILSILCSTSIFFLKHSFSSTYARSIGQTCSSRCRSPQS